MQRFLARSKEKKKIGDHRSRVARKDGKKFWKKLLKLFPLDETRHQFYAQKVVYTLETIDSQNSASSNQRRTRRQNRGTRNTACKHPNPKQTRSSSNKSPSVRTRPSETCRKSWSPLAREANKTRKQLIKPRNKRNELTEADTSCRSFIYIL